jgi:hypothetical protein
MKYLLYTLLLIGLNTTTGNAQKFIQMEKYGSAKVKKYYIGDELTYKLREYPNDWTTGVIEDIILAENLVVFTNRAVKLGEITDIRSFKPVRWSVPLAKNLYRFGVSWGVFSLLGPLVDTPITWAAAIVPASAFVTGFLIKRIFKQRTYRLGKRRWLRMLDMDQRFGP